MMATEDRIQQPKDDHPHPLLLDRLQHNVDTLGSKTVWSYLASGVDGGRITKSYTYQSLADETTRLAHRLLEAGLKKGDRALLVYPPSLDFTVAFLACLKAGIVAVPVFPPHPSRRDTLHMFATIAHNSQSQYALTNTEYHHMKKMAAAKDVVTRFQRPLVAGTWPESLEWIITDTTASSNKSGSKKSKTSTLPTISASDLAFLQYTSGSTSEPKGVMISHSNLAHNLTIITKELQAGHDTVVVSWLPQYHDMGLIGSYLGVIYCGGSGYYMSPLSFLQRPPLWVEAVSKYSATHLQAPNFAFKLTARKFRPSDYVNRPLQLSSVRHIINAAEPVDEDAIQTFYKAFGPFGLREVIYPTYGLAEHTVFVCSGGKQRLWVWKEKLEVDGVVAVVMDGTMSENDTGISRLVGCGFPSRQGVDVRIVDPETGRQVQSGRVGEIWINSPSKAVGYYGREDESKEDFYATITEDGGGSTTQQTDMYLRTGDLGFLYYDELFICGRLKDLIIVAGRNYYPQDIEGTAEATAPDLLRPGCSAAFSIDGIHRYERSGGDGSGSGGVNGDGEEVVLVMELRDVPKNADIPRVCDPLADQIRSAINRDHSLAVSTVVLVKTKTVPKTSSGKIARSWCRKGYLAGTLQTVYQKSFRNELSTLEIEASGESDPAEAEASGTGATGTSGGNVPPTKDEITKLRAMDRNDIMDKLRLDVSKMAQIPPDSIDNDTALVTILDSLSISQFKGRLEVSYGVTISDEYLFGETLTLKKLADVVKLGYAPDDGTNNPSNGGTGGAHATSPSSMAPTGKAGGISGALGCPPGVRCVIQ